MRFMNRREFLAWSAKVALATGAWAGAGPLLAATDRPAKAVNLPSDSIVSLPGHGTAFVVNDFHASWEDYDTFKKKTLVFEKMQNGQDVYLVINGDTVDTKPGHSQPDGDVRILDDLMEQAEKLSRAGARQRLVLLLGNHEAQNMALYACLFFNQDMLVLCPGKDKKIHHPVFLKWLEEEKKKWPSLDESQKERSLLMYVSQFNFAQRMKRKHYDFIKTFGLMARCQNGVMIMHGAYPRPGSTNPAYDLLCEREGDGKDFLDAIKGEMIVNGHTAPNLFGTRYKGSHDPQRGMGMAGGDRVIIAPSYGGGGTFLALDLSRTYLTEKDFILGREVTRLR